MDKVISLDKITYPNSTWIQSSHRSTYPKQDIIDIITSKYHTPKSPCNTTRIQSSHSITFRCHHATQQGYSHLIVSHPEVTMQDNMNTVIS
ncbi:hypothetical protein Bpfe_017240 [Biomphalaria pfeifferi]|uniref:Uncharacterized protein n=1 Tax=Biomphalaria pfeifferi TaxID=112525 RepID=A0AAD8BEW5_BIOPF|nr:hypothetical protein Bpfe_017240 [Biomphalaria pfeifferi]